MGGHGSCLGAGRDGGAGRERGAGRRLRGVGRRRGGRLEKSPGRGWSHGAGLEDPAGCALELLVADGVLLLIIIVEDREPIGSMLLIGRLVVIATAQPLVHGFDVLLLPIVVVLPLRVHQLGIDGTIAWLVEIACLYSMSGRFCRTARAEHDQHVG